MIFKEDSRIVLASCYGIKSIFLTENMSENAESVYLGIPTRSDNSRMHRSNRKGVSITFLFGSLNMRGSAATRLHRAVLHKLLRRVVIASIVGVCGSFGKG